MLMNPQLLLSAVERDAIAERVQQLLKAGCPSYSIAWYQVYDERHHVAGHGAQSYVSSMRPAVAAETSPTTAFRPLRPEVVELPTPVTADEMLERQRTAEKLEQPVSPRRGAGLNQEQFASRVGEILGTLNAVHAFREGNGAQREFVRELAYKNSYWIDWNKVSREELYQASDASFRRGDSTLFEKLLKGAIEPIVLDRFPPDARST